MSFVTALDRPSSTARIFLWCMFMYVGALLWGHDAQVRLSAYLGHCSRKARLDDVRTDQVGGGLLSSPQFRTEVGYVSDDQPILPASWQSAFNSVSSIGASAFFPCTHGILLFSFASATATEDAGLMLLHAGCPSSASWFSSSLPNMPMGCSSSGNSWFANWL